MTSPPAASPAGIGTAHRPPRPVTAVGKDRYSTGTTPNHADTTSPYNRTKVVSDSISLEEFNERLANLVVDALQNEMKPSYVAASLIRGSHAIVLGAGISIDELMRDLADVVVEMNGSQQGYLH